MKRKEEMTSPSFKSSMATLKNSDKKVSALLAFALKRLSFKRWLPQQYTLKMLRRV